MHVTYANCFLAEEHLGDLLVTNELCVARSCPRLPVKLLDWYYDDAVAERLNAELWDLAFSWFRNGESDPTVVSGISAGDLAGAEAAISILIPAVRGVLEARLMLDEFVPEKLTIVTATSPVGHYSRNERIQADAFAEAVSQLAPKGVDCTRATSKDTRSEMLVRKYARARDPDWLAPGPRLRTVLTHLMLGLAGTLSSLRMQGQKRSLVVVEYGPTRAFSTRYSAWPHRDLRLVRLWPSPSEIAVAVRRGDLIQVPPRPRSRKLDERLRVGIRQAIEDASVGSFVFEGVDVRQIVLPHLMELVERYAAFALSRAPGCRDELIRWKSVAVLVPFDTPPEARLLVRTAQYLGVPTLAINDGFKGDDFSREGMATDVAMAWSAAIRDGFFRRRSDGTAVVTGNPRRDVTSRPAEGHVSIRRTRLLIGSFTFSPIDLNCRRSDPERFLAEILEGINSLQTPVEQIVIKLHPADSDDHYREVLDSYASLPVEVVRGGDVVDMLRGFDVYITTYSTSLIEAVALGIPVIYYRVNPQHHQPPFSRDEFMASRTATSPDDVTRLLEEAPTILEDDARREWTEQYLGPQDGRSVERIVATIEERLRTEAARP